MTVKYFISLQIVGFIDKSAKFRFQQNFLNDQNEQISENKVAAKRSNSTVIDKMLRTLLA